MQSLFCGFSFQRFEGGGPDVVFPPLPPPFAFVSLLPGLSVLRFLPFRFFGASRPSDQPTVTARNRNSQELLQREPSFPPGFVAVVAPSFPWQLFVAPEPTDAADTLQATELVPLQVPWL